MSLAEHLPDVAFASAYNVDKIVGVYQGSFAPNTSATTTLGGYLYQYAIPHPFTRPVFTDVIWSTNNITFADGGGSFSLGGPQSIAYSDSSNIYVTTGVASGTIYYKVIASWIDNYDTTNPRITPVLNTTQPRFFDSSANYQKVIQSGSATGRPTLYTNPLTYDPTLLANAKLFFESLPGQVWPAIGGGVSDYFLYDPAHQWEALVGINYGTALIIGSSAATASNARFWWRIYGDTQ